MADLAALSVLIIEDDPDTRENLADLLALDGIQAAQAATVGEALVHPSLVGVNAVLLDRQLPDGVAEEVLPLLKERAPEAAVLIVTGHADLEGAIRALREGAEDYLLKPINPDLLRSSLQRIAKLQRAQRELRLRSAQQEIVARLGQRALGGAPLDELFRAALGEVLRALRVAYGRILERPAEEARFRVQAELGQRPASWPEEPEQAELDEQPPSDRPAPRLWAVIQG